MARNRDFWHNGSLLSPKRGGTGVIHVRSLRVDYEDVTAVLDLDLDIAPGEIYGLVGPNGAGKTSTIKAVAGILEATYGEVRIGDAHMAHNPEEGWRTLGYMPDFPPVYEQLRVWEYLDVFGAAHLLPRKDRRARARYWLERVQLVEEWNTLVGDLSRGMCQRLVLAKTLMHEPKALLLDEPASGMDPVARIQLRDVLREVARKGAAILVSSHILSELSDMCTSIGVMDRGHMVVSGGLEEIRRRSGLAGRLIVRIAGTGEPAHAAIERILRGAEVVLDPRRDTAGVWTAAFTGGDNEAAALLAALAGAGVPVAEFQVRKEGIEDIFLRVSGRAEG